MSTVNFIPPAIPARIEKAAIYCRVSSNSQEQLESMAAQASGLTKLVANTPRWLLVDVYIDVASAKENSKRKEFGRMLEDAKAGRFKILLTKSVSRFGRDTVETLEAIRILKDNNVRIIFVQEDIDTSKDDSNFIISVIESIAQSENETRSSNIKWGLKQAAASGKSKLYDRPCYGYKKGSDGNLVIDPDEAQNVRKIFNWYLNGDSVVGIIKRLSKFEIKSPTGKDRWNKRTIETMLANEKYTGDVRLFDLSNKNKPVQYLSEGNHPAIISKEQFQAVKLEKTKRSNITKDEAGNKVRKTKKYSSKKG